MNEETRLSYYCATCGDGPHVSMPDTCPGCANPFVEHPDPASLKAADPGPVPENGIDAEIDEAIASLREGDNAFAAIVGLKAAVEDIDFRVENLKTNFGDWITSLDVAIDELAASVVGSLGKLADLKSRVDVLDGLRDDLELDPDNKVIGPVVEIDAGAEAPNDTTVTVTEDDPPTG